ncbi:uncharacterized protein DUF4233 [Leucobacter luti]|uniref:Uncharacterized protein DUF4233 n=1 Tax=Leucobacter luti TaxID=340320 RepID=A0A4R6RZ99_9MICO|nr:DUF4233 domain-containing protein [Leucobacter luti]MCW2287789.1 type IV secretory pathway TrbD component [Leucobacter luti]TCK46048.1 uncharacterized protein DUF4233 [Leucobacter luti]TDP92470.1 uncharacterized protein DUF4233 [Leucobacter luti]
MSHHLNNDGAAEDPELQLSPSETMAHNSAMRISGARRGPQSTQKALASIVLGFELIVVVLFGLTMFGLGTLEPRELGLYLGGGLALVMIFGLALMRRENIGIVIGWIAHGLMLATAILLPMSLIVSLLFTALWIYCMVKGSQMDRDRAAWIAAQGE